MTNRALHGMSRALFDSDLIASRLALFIAETLWAIMLFWPGGTFDRPTYSEMAKVAPELVWATAFGISAVLQETGVITPGQFVRYRTGPQHTQTGIVRGTAIDWQRPRLRQTLEIEAHEPV